MYRNDFAFSVAEHIASDYSIIDPFNHEPMEGEPYCKPLPIPYILTSDELDEVVDIDQSSILMKTFRCGREIPCKVTSSFHCTNKVSLQKHLPKIVELYE
jgi:hypothetical protein